MKFLYMPVSGKGNPFFIKTSSCCTFFTPAYTLFEKKTLTKINYSKGKETCMNWRIGIYILQITKLKRFCCKELSVYSYTELAIVC